ncbi:unnamed protein product, partial [Lymnaea stagnalis]
VIGKPVFVKQSTSLIGTWMVDPKPTAASANKIWVTLGLEGETVLEYSSEGNFEKGVVERELSLSGTPFFGTGHVVSGGFLYYHWARQQKIVRYNLALGEVTTVRQLSDLNHKVVKGSKTFLYHSESLFVDFNVDENGLWIIYSLGGNPKLMVALLNEETLDIVKSLHVEVQVGSKGNAFIACGKLYTVRHHNRQTSFVDEEHDLWHNRTQPIKITVNNPYGNTVMLTYDTANRRLLAWDAGRQLRSPLLLKDSN